MTPEQTDLLIRVDQNVINLVNTFNTHIKDDKDFQDAIRIQVNTLNNDKAERRGVAKFASILYGLVIAGLGAVAGVKYGSR